MPESKRDIAWDQADSQISGLETDREWLVQVRREAIPLVFVPGIMGTRLRRNGTDEGLPDVRWDPGDPAWMWWNYSGAAPQFRKDMLVGPSFTADYLRVANSDPVGDGFEGIMDDYRAFLLDLRSRGWGALGKIFEFPVYAVGYNWTDTAESAGASLASRIKDIIKEAANVTGRCEKVILITHSMGGIVARAASEMAGAKPDILGIIHGVQPVNGAPAAYWRMKAGFEGSGLSGRAASRILGNSGATVTPILGNIPGGLQLLPNKLYPMPWLSVTRDGRAELELPRSDPYAEIYSVRAVVRPRPGDRPSTNTYWGLADTDLLDPSDRSAARTAEHESEENELDAEIDVTNPWEQYRRMLKIAEIFHERLKDLRHTSTFCFRGSGHNTADRIELRIESNWVRWDSYPTRGFRGLFADAGGAKMQAVLQDAAGQGDGTVPLASSGALDDATRPPPRDRLMELEHQPAYEAGAAQHYTIAAIVALAQMRYGERRS
jgi:hypothetical protein